IGGTSGAGGKLIFAAADPKEDMVTGTSDVPSRKWCHVALVQDGSGVRVYLNGRKTPEIDADVRGTEAPNLHSLIIGGCRDRAFGFEGRIAKVAVFNRLLTHEEIARHYEAAEIHESAPARGQADQDVGSR
ncbi:MAG: LamG-like jellyroll fold domain-containing protein, partial [Planctomycetota bacterium]